MLNDADVEVHVFRDIVEKEERTKSRLSNAGTYKAKKIFGCAHVKLVNLVRAFTPRYF